MVAVMVDKMFVFQMLETQNSISIPLDIFNFKHNIKLEAVDKGMRDMPCCIKFVF
jgi:hypothetical protein